MVELAIYALIAIFIFSRLYNSLGRASILNLRGLQSSVIDKGSDLESEESYEQDENILDYIDQSNADKIKACLTSITNKDKNFSVINFINGASIAFELIIKAFNVGNLVQLKSLTESTLYATLEEEVQKRQNAGEIHESTIVSIKSQKIVEIKLIRNIAFIAVRFLSEQINCIKDQSEKLISGSIEKINKIEDIWQFKRSIASSSPKWLLVSTNYKI